MFDRILIANRGEIACRVIRTCRRLGVETVAVHSDADRDARHVRMADAACRIGGPRPADSYLVADRIIEAARVHGAQAIHPGYGFLSENADFARRCADAGIVFIGPTPEAIDAMGSKHTAKALMERAGVPVVPGYHGEGQDESLLLAEARRIGFPLLIKAVAGGGGKGMRLVEEAAAFSAQLAAARREAASAFGDDRVLIERFIVRPRHIEFQVFGDNHGNVVHLFERECSIQRRHQKILEETPLPLLTSDLRARMGAAAVAAARAIGYRGAGTIEFIASDTGDFHFMEMNTRLQVEHPVTEMTTGQDLVEWQLLVAAGRPLPLAQEAIRQNGHAIEVRICAENPDNDFMPETGTIRRFAIPRRSRWLRVDTGVQEGDAVGVHYDPLIAKLIVHGADRTQATARLARVLGGCAVMGVGNNIALLHAIARDPVFRSGDVTTAYIGQRRAVLLAKPDAAPDDAVLAAAGCILLRAEEARAGGTGSPWADPRGWRLNAAGRRTVWVADVIAGRTIACGVTGSGGDYVVNLPAREVALRVRRDDVPGEPDLLRLEHDGVQRRVRVLQDQRRLLVLTPEGRHAFDEIEPFAWEAAPEVPGGRLTALMPGRIVKVMVQDGDAVSQGQPLLVMEAMKMEHTIHSPRDGVIERVVYGPDAIVEADAVLFRFVEAAAPSA